MAQAQARQNEAYAFQRMLQPFMLDQMGLEMVGGRIQKRAATAEEQRASKIRQLAEEKVIAGLEGRLDIDPAATRAFEEDERQREEYLARALGPDAKVSSSGARLREQGRAERRMAESGIRRGEMTAGEAIAQGRIAGAERNRAIDIGLMRGLPQDLLGANAAFVNYPAEAEAFDFLRGRERRSEVTALGGGLLTGAAGLGGAYIGARARPQNYFLLTGNRRGLPMEELR